VQQGIADELLVQIYRPELNSYLPHLTRPEVQKAKGRIPTAIAVMSGQRNRPTSLELMRRKVEANRVRGLGVAFFYFESLWSLGPEPKEQRIRGLADILGSTPAPPLPSPPPPLTLQPSPAL
jgi:uncharacterized lipoprotein YddW (UPF0748 family)